MVIDDGTSVYLVPVVDVNWLVYAPFDPERGYRVDPPNVEKSIGETRLINRELAGLTGGKALFTPHSGTYCRTGYYEGEMLAVYREAAAGGAELAVHLHEEIKGAGTRYAEPAHMRAVFSDCRRRLADAGLRPVAYRGGHYAYHPLMNGLLAASDIWIDCSCSPGLNEPDREAIWTNADASAFYLPDDPRRPSRGQLSSGILEIPIGSDGKGASYRNILHVEKSDLDNLRRIFDAIVARARQQGRPQIVHALFHTGSVGNAEWLERFRRFLDLVPRRGGAFVNATEAKAVFDRLPSEAAA
jgi:hypothetical protein